MAHVPVVTTWRPRAGAGWLAFVMAGLAIGCSAGGGPAADQGGRAAITVQGECDDRIERALSAWGTAGFNGAVVVDDGTGSGGCRAGVGSAESGGIPVPTVESVFAIGSVSKAFTAVAVLQLAAEGVLDLGDPAGRYVAGLRGPAGDASIESLLLHTSGLVGSHGEDQAPLGRDEAVAAISRLPVDDAAQGRFLYSNAGYTLLALVIEGASGVEYRRYLTDRVLPDGAGFWADDADGAHWALQGNGDLAMSVEVLARWTRALFTGSIVPATAVERLVEPAVVDGEQGITMGWVRLGAERPRRACAGGGGRRR